MNCTVEGRAQGAMGMPTQIHRGQTSIRRLLRHACYHAEGYRVPIRPASSTPAAPPCCAWQMHMVASCPETHDTAARWRSSNDFLHHYGHAGKLATISCCAQFAPHMWECTLGVAPWRTQKPVATSHLPTQPAKGARVPAAACMSIWGGLNPPGIPQWRG